jgi:hypothetical protein
VGAGVLHVDAEIAVGPLGSRSMTFRWLTVAPARLNDTGEALAAQSAAAFVATTVGRTARTSGAG